MKKFLSLILALLMILSLCAFVGCAEEAAEDEKEPAADASDDASGDAADDAADDVATDAEVESTEEIAIGDWVVVEKVTYTDGTVTYDGIPEADLDTGLAFENVPQKLAAGKDVLVAWEQVQLDDQFNVMMVEGLQADLEPLGFTYMVSEFKNDSAVQIQHIENYLTMGAVAVVTSMNDPNAGSDLCAMCEAAGCYFLQQGSVPDGYVSMAVNVDQAQIGEKTVEMMQAWLDINQPDAAEKSIPVCFLGNTTNTDPALRTQVVEECVNADPRTYIDFTNHNSLGLDVAFNAVVEAYTYNPDFKMVLTFNSTQGIGANNYIISIPNVNLEEYAIFCNQYNDEVLQLIDQADTNDGSVIRGTIGFGGNPPWSNITVAIKGLLDGSMEPGYVLWEPNWAINNFGFEYDYLQK